MSSEVVFRQPDGTNWFRIPSDSFWRLNSSSVPAGKIIKIKICTANASNY